jgi:hypothetical protein
VPYPCPTFVGKQYLLRISPRLENPCRDSVRTRHQVLTCYHRPKSVVQPDVRRSKLPGYRRLGCLDQHSAGSLLGCSLDSSENGASKRWLGKDRQNCKNIFVVPNYPSRPLTVTKTSKTELRWSKCFHIQDQGSDRPIQTSTDVATPMHCLPM